MKSLMIIILLSFNNFYTHSYPTIEDTITHKEPAVCNTAQFQCGQDGRCIPESWTCDGEKDCEDSSDEQDCPPEKIKVCGKEEFRCGVDSGKCIPLSWQCDGEIDCPGGLDEWDQICKVNKEERCDSGEFRCEINGACIPAEWRCDGHSDCKDGADEEHCKVNCTADEFRCSNGECIQKRWVCDGTKDCADESDEEKCEDEDVRVENLTGCQATEFRCDTGHCIDINWKCDGERDCPDGSDETTCPEDHSLTSQKTAECGEETWTCGNKLECVQFGWLCDGDIDCSDGSDEMPSNCESSNSSRNTSQKAGTQGPCNPRTEFDCGTVVGCIPHERVCDQHNDCGNWEDEPSTCHLHINECEENNGGCEQLCVDTEESYYCDCRQGYRLEGGSSCQDVDECSEEGGKPACSQECHNTPGSHTCSCLPGYTMDSMNSSICRVAEGRAAILFSDGGDIRLSDTSEAALNTTAVGDVVTRAEALDFLYSGKLVFWTDPTLGKIYRTKMFSDEQVRVVLVEDSVLPGDQIAVDWVHSNIFWASRHRRSIVLANYDGGNQVEVVRESVEQPRGLAVHPKKGLIFWSEAGQEPRILRARMDGSDLRVLFHSRDQVLSPGGVALDLVRDRVYWTDSSLHRISSADLDGREVRVVLTDLQHLQQPLSVTVLEDWLYWTDAVAGQTNIYKANKFDGSGLVKLTSAHPTATQISVRAFHSVLQPKWKNYCETRERKCSHVCVPSLQKSVSSEVLSDSECLCPNKLELLKDNSTCQGEDIDTNNRTSPSGLSSNPVLDQEIEAHHNSQEKTNLIIVLIIGVIGASVGLVILISVIVCKQSKGDRSVSEDSLQKPSVNRNLYQPPRRRTFSQCIPDSESIVPLNSEGSISSRESPSSDGSENV